MSRSIDGNSVRNELRRYIVYDNEIRKRNAETAVLRQKRKASEDAVLAYIQTQQLRDMEVKLPDGMLVYKEREVAGSLSPSFLREALVNFYTNENKSTPAYAARYAETVLQFIMRQRSENVRKVPCLKRTFQGKNVAGADDDEP